MTLAPQCVTFVKFYCSKCSRCTEKFCSAQHACIVCSQGSAFAFFSGGGEVEAVLVAAFLGVNHFLRVFCLLLTSNLYQHTHAHTHQSHWASVWAYNFMYMHVKWLHCAEVPTCAHISMQPFHASKCMHCLLTLGLSSSCILETCSVLCWPEMRQGTTADSH